MSAEIDKAKQHLAALKTFIASPAHSGYIAARDEEIANIQNRILLTPPINQDNIASLIAWHSEMDCQVEMKRTFEEARTKLEARIDEMVEQENKNASNTKV